MSDADDRLGAKGVDEIKAHPFFRGLDWNNLRTGGPSKYARLDLRDDDTSRFDKFDEEESFYPNEERKSRK
jgi:serine/threonine kinase 38